MNNKETIYITPDKLTIISPELESASVGAGASMYDFISWLQANIDPELERYEATILASAIITKLPELLNTSPAVITAIKNQATHLKSLRKQ